MLYHIIVFKSVSTSFVYGNYKGTYEDSKQHCEGLGLQVIKLETQNDVEELNNWIGNNKEVEFAWLGMKYINSEFKWFDGTSLAVSNWDDVHDDEPDNLDTQHCAVIRQADLKWDSRTCQSNFTAVCQTVKAVGGNQAPASDADNANPSNEPASDQTKGDTSVSDADQVPRTQDEAVTVTEPGSYQTKDDASVQEGAEAVTQSPNLSVRTIQFGVFAKNRYLDHTPLFSKSNTGPVQCAITCSRNTQCSYFVIEASACNIYQATDPLLMVDKIGSSIWKRS
ncbi:hypothetical protein SNE40_016460 [Patella caerulea]|uniref:C-type lectin domain-containing protein n=1 Tax=Patella caerulea TaxID=87958 RepID=A0AAN8PNK6_PATCE